MAIISVTPSGPATAKKSFILFDFFSCSTVSEMRGAVRSKDTHLEMQRCMWQQELSEVLLQLFHGAPNLTYAWLVYKCVSAHLSESPSSWVALARLDRQGARPCASYSSCST